MTTKNLGVGTPSPGVPSPLKLFLDSWTQWNLVYIIHEFETRVGPLDVIRVEFRHRGNVGCN